MNKFNGKTAIVTGASSGIGRAIAKDLAQNGANVIATARREDRLNQLQDECSESSTGNIHPISIDINDPEAHKIITTQALEINGEINYLINNAATGTNKAFKDLNQEEIIQTVNTNLLSTIRLTQEVHSTMKDQQNGNIIFVTSLAGVMGFPGLSIYSSTKFALEGFAQSLRFETESDNINIVVLRPGVTDTEFFVNAGMEEFAQTMREEGKIHTPERVSRNLLRALEKNRPPTEVIVGNDKWFIKLLPFIPHSMRFQILDIFNKLS